MRRAAILGIFLILCFGVRPIFPAEETFSKDDEAAFGLAQSLNNLRRYEESIEALQSLHRKYPASAKVALELAKAYGYSRRMNEAAALLADLEKTAPADEELQKTHLSILEANQKFPEARKKVLDRLREHPEDEESLLKAAELSSWMKDYETSVRFYRKLIGRRPADRDLKAKLADVLFWSQSYEQAIRLYESLGLDPKTDREKFKNLGHAYFGLRQFSEAGRVYRLLLKDDPDDLEIQAHLAGVLYAMGRNREAEREFRALVEKKSGDKALLLKLAEVLASLGEYDEAIRICRDILARTPQDSDALLGLARSLSWARKYKESLRVYDDAIKLYPNWFVARREKAQVLGWMRRYRQSVREYHQLLKQYDVVKKESPESLGEIKSRSVLENEMQAKKNDYNQFDRKAMKHYRQWLEAEPENLEANFGLGQILSRQMQWRQARMIYREILKIYPAYQRAKEALKKVELDSKSASLSEGFDFRERDSASRVTDEKYFNIYTKATVPVNAHADVNLREDTFLYSFSNLASLNRQRLAAELEFHEKPYVWGNAGYAYNFYSDVVGNSQEFYEEINVKPVDQTTLTFRHNRQDITDNANVLKAGLHQDHYKIRAELEPCRRLTAGTDYQFSHYSDSNDRHNYGADVKLNLLYEPTRFAVRYRYEAFNFQKSEAIYFSPNSFHSNELGFEWQHYLNREELFWGARDTYYRLAYSVIFDVHGQHGHKLRAGIYKDWSSRFSMGVDWEKLIYEHQSNYREDQLTGSAKIYF